MGKPVTAITGDENSSEYLGVDMQVGGQTGWKLFQLFKIINPPQFVSGGFI